MYLNYIKVQENSNINQMINAPDPPKKEEKEVRNEA